MGKIINISQSNIVRLEDFRIQKVKDEILDIMNTLQEDYDIFCTLQEKDIYFILKEFYCYYEEKNIEYSFEENMIHHFHDMAIDVIGEDGIFDYYYVLDKLKLYELLESEISVNPKDTTKIIRKLKQNRR